MVKRWWGFVAGLWTTIPAQCMNINRKTLVVLLLLVWTFSPIDGALR
jgi:hypothetical protein